MDCTIIEKLRSNELEFCKNWSDKAIELKNSVHILANGDLGDDYFLNRVFLVDGSEDSNTQEKEILSNVSSLKEISKKQIPTVYVHIDDNYSSHKSILEKNGFREIDKLIGLVRVVNNRESFSIKEFGAQKSLLNGETYKVVETSGELDEWIDVYISSFGIAMEKRNIIRTILHKENFRNSKFILSEQKSIDNINQLNLEPMGCCMFFPTNNVLGLYCLGTNQKYRNKGIASRIIDFAVAYAIINNLNYLGLQALYSDHKIEFYQRRQFTKVYTNAIYSLPVS
ncbi:GNAT family N-acetyltransferase [Candidatus Nitrosocosmicus sp. T]